MRFDASAYTSEDIVRDVQVYLWQGDSVADVLDGTAVGQVDISAYATSVRMTESSLRVGLAYNDEFIACSAQPKVGDLLSVTTDGTLRYLGIIDNLSAYYEARGDRHIDISSRGRDGLGGWKSVRATSAIFPLGTNLDTMLRSITEDLMALSTSEYTFPSIPYQVPHSNAQFNDETPWDMVSTVLEAANYVPFVNVLNQVAAYSKSLTKVSDITIPTSRLISKTGSSQQRSHDRVRLRWLDSGLSRSTQQSQLLYSTAMTAGFFDTKQEEETWWSDDHRQRAQNVYFKIIDSVNAGIIDVADEDFDVIDEFHGEIQLRTKFWVPALFTMATVTMLALAANPDNVEVVVTLGVGTGFTIPVGRIAQAATTAAILFTMMSIGVGRYEIWGEPYDYVHARNSTLAYVENYPAWLRSEKEIENDLITNENHAQSVAIADLLYEAAQAYSMGVEIIDDPRIEVGDILEFEDGTRMMVRSFSNDFSRDAAAAMSVEGVLV